MRTTVNIEDQALEACRKRAVETGKSLGEVISEAILQTLSGRPASAPKRRYKLPVSGRGGLQPGVDLDNWARIEDVMDGLA